MTSWKTYRLGDIADIQTGPFGSQLHNKDYADEGTPIVTVEHLGNRHFTTQNLPLVSDTDKARLSKYILSEGDIVFSRVGSVDRCSYVSKAEDGWMFSGRCLRVRCSSKAYPLYVYYYFCLESIKQYIRNVAVGATMPSINTQIMSEIPISLPSLEEQRRIAGILGAIDDKIENNRRINTNLELQAQALYKQWFVDNRSDDWEEKPLAEIAEFIGGYSYKGNELVDTSTMAMATIKNFERKGGFKVEGFKDIVASSKLKAEQHAKLFDILVAHTDLTQNADVIGNAEILLTCGKYSDIIFSMDLVKVLPKACFPYKYLLAALLKNPYFKAHCLGYVNGTTVLHMSKKALPEYVVACPINLEAEKMNCAFKAYYHKMAEILQENETLATLRDTLLPKLMNGEIKVCK